MCVQVQRVSNMPFNIKVWVDPESQAPVAVYVDKQLIEGRDVPALEQMLSGVHETRSVDADTVRISLMAITR